MKPYKLIEGTHSAIEAFEKQVAEALESGYSFAGELVTQAVGSDIKFFQPVIFEDDDFDDEDDEEEDEDEDDN